jgi:hypothetical protein
MFHFIPYVVRRRPLGEIGGQGADEAFLPLEGARRHHLAHEVAADDAGAGAGLVDQRSVVEVGGGQDAGHGAADAQAADQGSGVDTLDADDVVLSKVGVKGAVRAEVARCARELADDEALDLGPARFGVLGIDAVVADERVGHGNDLSLVRRVGQHLLVAGHAGVEHDLAEGFAGRAEAPAGVDCAVFQGQFCNFHQNSRPKQLSHLAPQQQRRRQQA